VNGLRQQQTYGYPPAAYPQPAAMWYPPTDAVPVPQPGFAPHTPIPAPHTAIPAPHTAIPAPHTAIPAPQAAPGPVSATDDTARAELRELGELLRRQAGDRRDGTTGEPWQGGP
jgi:hypothetical protein